MEKYNINQSKDEWCKEKIWKIKNKILEKYENSKINEKPLLYDEAVFEDKEINIVKIIV